MSISKIKKDLEGQKKFPPVDQWNPDLCEGQEFFIDREGDWYYNSSPIKNSKLINLFSTVLWKDESNYFLVTPVEKVPVKVDLAPYKIIDFEIVDDNIKLITNLNYDFFLDEDHVSRLVKYEESYVPLVIVRNNIEGFINRNTYYKLVDLAISQNHKEDNYLYLRSFNINHVIGKIA